MAAVAGVAAAAVSAWVVPLERSEAWMVGASLAIGLRPLLRVQTLFLYLNIEDDDVLYTLHLTTTFSRMTVRI